MYTVMDLYAALVRQGVALRVADGQLKTRAPKGILTEGMRQSIREHKGALIALLTQQSVAAGDGACVVSPTGRHQWYVLSSGAVTCLSCLMPVGDTQ
jgi:L-cysteine---[L-cysteinyl-carrier protein] ligase PchF